MVVRGRAYNQLPRDMILREGGGSGIGQLMCVEFARRGAIVVSWDLSAEGNNKTAALVNSLGGNIFTYICDVSKKSEVEKVANQVKSEVGDVTILINNAGIVNGTKFLDTPDDKLVKTMEINVMAHFWTLKNFLPSMIQKNRGHVVTIASMAGLIGTSGLADYTAAKFANVGFTESLLFEVRAAGANNVHLTTVCPHRIDTGMFEGCKDRFQWMMPAMSPEYASKRIVKAVLTNQAILCMPRSMYLFTILKSILPTNAAVALHEFFGADHYMDDFVGRQKD